MAIEDVDLALSEDGDLVADDSGDLALSEGGDCRREDIMVRVRTIMTSWRAFPEIGHLLNERLIGKPNNAETARLGEALLRQAITSGLSLVPSTLSVFSIPDKPTRIVFIVVYEEPGMEAMQFTIPFDLQTGI